MMAIPSQIHRRRDDGFELFVEANLLSFRAWQDFVYGVI